MQKQGKRSKADKELCLCKAKAIYAKRKLPHPILFAGQKLSGILYPVRDAI